jgi:hypothetical protein
LKEVDAMFATLNAALRVEARALSEEGVLRQEWARLLATATSPQERDEINDVFGRAIAA